MCKLPVLPDPKHPERCSKDCPNLKEQWVQTHPDDFPYCEGARCERFHAGIDMRYGDEDDTPIRWRACVGSLN